MAQKVVVDIVVNTSSLNQATEAVDKLGKKTNEVAGKEGVGKLSESAKGIGDSIKKSFGGAKDAIEGLGASTKAVQGPMKLFNALVSTGGVGLLVTAIGLLITGLVTLKDKIPFVGAAFDAIGSIIDTVVGSLKNFSDWLGLSDFAAQDKAQNTIDNAKLEQDAIEKRYDREIKIAEASGKATEDIEIRKQQAILESLAVQRNALEAMGEAQGRLSDEQKTQLKELNDKIAETNVNIEVLNAQKNAKIEADEKKHNDELAKIREEKLKKIEEDYKKEISLLDKAIADAKKKYGEDSKEFLKNQQDKNKASEEFYKKQTELLAQNEIDRAKLKGDAIAIENAEYQQKLLTLQSQYDAEFKVTQAYKDKLALLDQEHNAKVKDINVKSAEEIASQKRQTEDNYFAAATILSDTFFAGALAKAKGNQAKELEIKKKQFLVEKAFNAGRIVIDTARAISKTIAELGGVAAITPPGAALVASIGVLGAAQLAKVLTAKFDGGGSSGGGEVNVPNTGGGSVGSGGTGQAQPTSTFQAPGLIAVGGAGSGQRSNVLKAIVVSTDITKEQGVDKILERRSSY